MLLPILFVHYGDDWIRGSETLLLDLLGELNKDLIRPIIWCNSNEMARACREASLVTYQDEFHHAFDYSSPRINAIGFGKLVQKCRTICREQGIRVLHANGAAPIQWLVPAALSLRLPVLAHLHTNYLRRSRYVLLLHLATLIVGVSSHVTEELIADGMALDRVRVIHNGIDARRLGRSTTDLRVELGIPSEALVVAAAGSLIPRKGHDVLVKAFHATRAPQNSTHLLIAGSGPEEEKLHKLAAALGINERVHLLGNMSDMAKVYRAADIFALASRGDAFGLVLAEAGLFGLPAVSTRVGGIPEVILDEKTGLLTPSDDVPAFANALSRLAADPLLRRQLGVAAAARVKTRFTVAQMARLFEDTYTELSVVPESELGWRGLFERLRPYRSLI